MEPSNDALVATLWLVAMVEVGVVFALLLVVLILHITKGIQLRRRTRFHAVWRPLLVQSLTDIPRAVPPVARGETMMFLYYWNYFHESLLGQDKIKGLNELARLAGMNRAALKLLKAKSVSKRLMAIITVGHLGERKAWNDLLALAQSPHPIISLSAARALIHIDPQAALSLVTPWIGTRTDWSPPKVAALLYQLGPEHIAQRLSEATMEATPSMTIRLLHFLQVTRCQSALPAVRTLLARKSTEPAVRVACLKLIGQFQDPKDLNVVRSYLTHGDPGIRAQAAAALGANGTQTDEGRLVPLLSDEEWAVRYQAAEALAHLPFMRRERLAEIRDAQTDPRAKRILASFLPAATGYSFVDSGQVEDPSYSFNDK